MFFYFVKSIARGRNWARITMLVLYCIGLPFTIMSLPDTLSRDLISAFFAIVNLVASAVAYVFLFTGEAHQWYSTGKTSNNELLDDF
jgi:hypothetical protein